MTARGKRSVSHKYVEFGGRRHAGDRIGCRPRLANEDVGLGQLSPPGGAVMEEDSVSRAAYSGHREHNPTAVRSGLGAQTAPGKLPSAGCGPAVDEVIGTSRGPTVSPVQ